MKKVILTEMTEMTEIPPIVPLKRNKTLPGQRGQVKSPSGDSGVYRTVTKADMAETFVSEQIVYLKHVLAPKGEVVNFTIGGKSLQLIKHKRSLINRRYIVCYSLLNVSRL